MVLIAERDGINVLTALTRPGGGPPRLRAVNGCTAGPGCTVALTSGGFVTVTPAGDVHLDWAGHQSASADHSEDIAVTVEDALGVETAMVTLVLRAAGATPSMADRVSQRGVTFQFDRAYPVARYADGSWAVDRQGGAVTVTAITPQSHVSTGRYATGERYMGRAMHGAMLDPGNQARYVQHPEIIPEAGTQGWDSIKSAPSKRQKTQPYQRELNVDPGHTGHPLVIDRPATLVKAMSDPIPQPTGRAALKSLVALTITDGLPPEGSFRPPQSTLDKVARWRVADLDFDALPRLSTPASVPDVSARGARWLGTVMQVHVTSGTQRRAIAPQDFGADYGAHWSRDIGQALLALCTLLSLQDKRDMVLHLVQAGIDIYGRWHEDGLWAGKGGLDTGPLGPLYLAGHLLGDPDLRRAASRHENNRFAEFRQIKTVPEKLVTAKLRSEAGRPRAPYTPAMVGQPEWGEQFSNQLARNGSNRDAIYRQIVLSGSYGLALALRLMNGVETIRHDAFFDYYDRVHGFSQRALNIGKRNGITRFDAQMWAEHREFPPGEPEITGAFTKDTTLWVVFDRLLREGEVPPLSDFKLSGERRFGDFLRVDGEVDHRGVRIFGRVLHITLDKAYGHADEVTIGYRPGTRALRGLNGEAAASFDGLNVENLNAR